MADEFRFEFYPVIYYFDRGIFDPSDWSRLDRKLKNQMSNNAVLIVYQEGVSEPENMTIQSLEKVAEVQRLGNFTGFTKGKVLFSIYQ